MFQESASAMGVPAAAFQVSVNAMPWYAIPWSTLSARRMNAGLCVWIYPYSDTVSGRRGHHRTPKQVETKCNKNVAKMPRAGTRVAAHPEPASPAAPCQTSATSQCRGVRDSRGRH